MQRVVTILVTGGGGRLVFTCIVDTDSGTVSGEAAFEFLANMQANEERIHINVVGTRSNKF